MILASASCQDCCLAFCLCEVFLNQSDRPSRLYQLPHVCWVPLFTPVCVDMSLGAHKRLSLHGVMFHYGISNLITGSLKLDYFRRFPMSSHRELIWC